MSTDPRVHLEDTRILWELCASFMIAWLLCYEDIPKEIKFLILTLNLYEINVE